MKKSVLKLTSLVLTLLLCFSIMTPAFAAGEENEVKYKKIYVHGMMASDILVDAEDESSEKAWPMETGKIVSTIAKAVPSLTKLAVNKDYDKFAAEVTPLVDELFAPACLNYNGEISNGSGVFFEYPEEEDAIEADTLKFKYDWRLNPLDTAEKLNDFIDYVLQCSDTDKVVIECHSLGGITTLTYLKMFGTDKVQSVLFDAPAIYGENYTGELLQGKIHLTDEGVKSYLEYAFDGMTFDAFLKFLVNSITDAGVMNYVCENLNDIVDVLLDKVELSLAKLFANWPTIWAMVPDDMLENAKTHIFDELYAGMDIDSSALQSKVSDYDALIRANREEILKSVNDSINVYVISRYGYSSVPLTPSWQNISDGTIETKYNSLGATTAVFGETLTDYNPDYVSPDKTIDASTCLFPKQTWFVKNFKHAQGSVEENKLIEALLYYDGQATVDTFSEYPQFLQYDAKNDYLFADGVYSQFEIMFNGLVHKIKRKIADFFGKFGIEI
ncbi:MAG: esterase/lipase family protein [Acutalibacteraceae bacterium]